MSHDQSSTAARSRRHHSHEGKVVGAFDPAAVDKLTTALEEAGCSADDIDVVTAEDMPYEDAPFARPGFVGAFARFIFSLGDELDEIEQMRNELEAGHVLVGVSVRGDEATRHVRDVMREQGGHRII